VKLRSSEPIVRPFHIGVGTPSYQRSEPNVEKNKN